MKINGSWLDFDTSSAIDKHLALMLVDAQCENDSICVVMLNSGAQCVVRKVETEAGAEFMCRESVAGGSVSLGGYKYVTDAGDFKKDWFSTSLTIGSLQVAAQLIESQSWNDKVLSIMMSLLSKMEVLSKTTKAGLISKY